MEEGDAALGNSVQLHQHGIFVVWDRKFDVTFICLLNAEWNRLRETFIYSL